MSDTLWTEKWHFLALLGIKIIIIENIMSDLGDENLSEFFVKYEKSGYIDCSCSLNNSTGLSIQK